MLYRVQTKSIGVPDVPAHGGARRMYKTSEERQLTFDGFNQSCGMKLNPKDEYVLLADMIDWAAVEVERFFSVRREAVLRRGTHHDEALEDHARQHRALSPRGEPVRSPAPASFFVSISWTRPTVCRRVICWKSRTRRHDGPGRRHPQATHGRRAARNPAPAAGSRLLWADTK